MRNIRYALLAFIIVVGPALAVAEAVTTRDLVDLKKAGLSDAVLIELIASDNSVFHLTSGDVRALHDQGLSDPVIIAMLKTAHPAVALPSPQPTDVEQIAVQPVAVQSTDDMQQPPDAAAPPALEPVSVMAPPVVVTQTAKRSDRVQPPIVVTVPVYVPVYIAVHPPAPVKPPEPVYWGWGGKRRPDTWNDATTPAAQTTPPPSSSTPSATPAGSASTGRGGAGGS